MGQVAVTRQDRWRGEWSWFRYRVREALRDGLPRWIAWHLPRRVVYQVLIRAWVFSLSGKWGGFEPTAVHTWETVRRWDEANH